MVAAKPNDDKWSVRVFNPRHLSVQRCSPLLSYVYTFLLNSFLPRGIISYYISIFQERIISPVKSELYVIQERIVDGSDWLICSAECLTNSKWSHDKTCQSELSTIRSWGPIICSWGPTIRSWGITLAGMFFLTYIIAYRTSTFYDLRQAWYVLFDLPPSILWACFASFIFESNILRTLGFVVEKSVFILLSLV